MFLKTVLVMDEIKTHILTWIDTLSIAHTKLNNLSICPFAKKAKYTIIKLVDKEINPLLDSVELIIYVLDNAYTFEQLSNIAKEYNALYPHLVFLPDGKDRHSDINGIPTSNGKYNLLLCQDRAELQTARNKLDKTMYYTFWDNNYLKEILEQ
jgi:hypothetical protein